MTTNLEYHKHPEKENRLLSSEERTYFSQVATKEPPHSSRAQALLAIDEGVTQAEAGRRAGLTKGQVGYWLRKFRKEGTAIFPEELVGSTVQEEADPLKAQEESIVPEVSSGAQTAIEEEAQLKTRDVEEADDQVVGAVTLEAAAPKGKKKAKKAAKKAKKKSKKDRSSEKMKKVKKAKKVRKPAKKKEANKAKSKKKAKKAKKKQPKQKKRAKRKSKKKSKK